MATRRAGLLAQDVFSHIAKSQSSSLTSTVPGYFARAIATALNHVAIAVPNLEKAAEKYKKVMGVEVSEPHSLPEHGVRVVFVHLANTKLELLEPIGADSPIANFLKKNPSGGMHHMCLEVPDIHAAIDKISATEVRLLDKKPKIGAHGSPVVFMHPKDMEGVLTELEEVKQ